MNRCIMAGLGWRGNCWLVPLRKRKDVQIVAYVEPGEANQKRAIAEGVSPSLIFPTIDSAIANVKADFVVDATPGAVHHHVAMTSFAAGLHVMAEKPLSDDFAKAKEMVAAGKRANRTHMITQNVRFGSQPRATRKAIASGLIGNVGQCDVRFYMPWADIPNSPYVNEPYMLLADMMVHQFDMMRYVLNTNATAIQAITWNLKWGWHKGDAAHAIVVEFENGIRGTHVCLGACVGKQTSWNGSWQIEGDAGGITWEDDKMWHTHMHRTPKPVHELMIARWRPAEDPTLLDDVLNEFLTAMKKGREPECSGADNLHTLAMTFAAIKSAKENRRVKIEEILG